MTRIVLIYGIIAGLIITAMIFITMPLYESGTLNFERGEILGYTTMAISMSMVFFGIKAYRDKKLGGVITFGRAFQTGILIALLAAVIYAAGWELNLKIMSGDFMALYGQHSIEKAKAAGATGAELLAIADKNKSLQEMYKNPFVRFGITMMELFPVGVPFAIVSAAILRRKEVLPA